MSTDELTELMHQGAPGRGGPPDLERIHRLGARRRWAHRAATGAAVAATVAVLAGAWTVLGPAGDGVTVRAASQDHEVTSVTAYEKRVLADVPGSYEVDGTVVLTDRMPGGSGSMFPPGDRVTGTPVPLGYHSMVGPGYLSSSKSDPAYQQNAPKGSQVVIDAGPAWLGCATSKKHPDCSGVVLVKDTTGRLRILNGFGTEDFLKPGAGMELFVDDDFSDRTWSQTLLGGFHSAETTRVLVEMTDGSQAEAELDVDSMSPGSTLFWAKLAKPVAWVRAYDADGALIAEHRLRACGNPVDCEVR